MEHYYYFTIKCNIGPKVQFYRVKLIQQILELKALQSIEIFIDFLNTKSYKLKNHFNTIQTPSHSASTVLGQSSDVQSLELGLTLHCLDQHGVGTLRLNQVLIRYRTRS